ncbi:hypothetical protein NE237_026068 [Protea cynaroides]|uniref:Uncharacterized protein n=1 Tax=Protea cynaroides TaxID=273540 RepID=A0A9Q0H321_9MAGN|nr:hypothetical protein NE237_026068 [Protea cynaroides]
MKLKFLRWFVIILCSQAFSGLAHEITHSVTHAGSELWGQIGEEKQQHGSKVTIGLEEDGKRRYEAGKIFHLGGRRGRGSGGHGGGNINSRPFRNNWKSDASTVLARHYLFNSVALVQVLVVFNILF